VISRIKTLDLRRANFALFKELLRGILWARDLEGRGVHECWSLFKRSLPPCTGAVHPPEKEIKQRRQETCMDEQGASSGAQVEEKGPWNVERGAGHLGRVQECGQSVQGCNEEGQADLELKLGRDVKNKKKGFFNYISSKGKVRDNVGPLLNEAGVLVTEDAEKAELLNAAFASVFSAKADPQESQAPEVREKAHREDDFPLVEEDCVRDRLSDLDVHKSMGPDGMHP